MWNEHLSNRCRMSAKLTSKNKYPDLPWSSWKRLQGVSLVCVTGILWVAGIAFVALLLILGPWSVRLLIFLYYAVTTLSPLKFNKVFATWASSLEIGSTNGWELIINAKEKEFRENNDPLLFCSHPHGLYCAGVVYNLILSKTAHSKLNIPYLRTFVHTLLLTLLPGVKEILRSLGYMKADWSTMSTALERGECGVIIPGGMAEAMWAGHVEDESDHLHLVNRKGFVKLAMSVGAKVVPVYTFGESLSCGIDIVPFFPFRLWVTSKIGLPLRALSLCQRWWLAFPEGKLVTVVGAPVQLPHIQHPSREEVSLAHEKYTKALLDLVESTKEQAGYPLTKIKLE